MSSCLLMCAWRMNCIHVHMFVCGVNVFDFNQNACGNARLWRLRTQCVRKDSEKKRGKACCLAFFFLLLKSFFPRLACGVSFRP